MKYGLAATIMLASSLRVNGEGVTFTETISPEQAKKGQSLKDLVTNLTEKGKEGQLAASVGPHIGLEDKAPIKYLSLRANTPHWQNRYCDLVFTQGTEKLPPHPLCFVIIDKSKKGHDLRFVNFKFDLTGRLVGAVEANGKEDEEGNPIRASGQAVRLDITDPKVRKEADALMDFWRLGRYKKYLPKEAPPATK